MVCLVSCTVAALSTNFPMNSILDTGLYFFSIRSRLAFLSRGLTKATLRLPGKIPDVSDLLIISVSIMITDGRISFNSVVGMGSISQLLLHEVLMMFSTSSCDSGSKQSTQGGIWSLTSNSSGGPVLQY